eukprot:g7537.t1
MENSAGTLVSSFRVEKTNDDENIKVFIRVRPRNQLELHESANNVCVQVLTEKSCMIDVQGKPEPYTLSFDHVFDQHSSQMDVFEVAGIPTVDNVLTGYNSTIFAYGQTGAGKTHTIIGSIKDEEQRGLTPRVFEYLFEKIKEEEATQNPPPQYKVKYSNLEIYNETITDLLTPNSTNLPIRNDTKLGSGTYVDGLKEVEVKCCKDAMDLIEIGTNNRTVSATNANLTSSRSHCVYTCVITRKQKSEDGSENTRVSRLNLVDLAGSERAKVSEGKNAQTLKEGCYINKSLTCLGRVIKELVEAQRKRGKVHVPYRDSKLTSLLQESLGGNARTTIIAGIIPMYSSSGESLSTLQFVQRAKRIKNKAKANEVPKQDPVALQMEVMKLRAQIERINEGGYKLDPNDIPSVFFSTPMQDFELDKEIQEMEGQISELRAQLKEAQLESERVENQNRKLESENLELRNLEAELQNKIDDLMKEFSFLQERLDEAEQATDNVSEAEHSINEKNLEDDEKDKHCTKITKIERELRDLVSRLGERQLANIEIQGILNTTNTNLYLKTNELKHLRKEYTDTLKQSEAKCKRFDSRLAEADREMKRQEIQIASLHRDLERTNTKAEKIATQNAVLEQSVENLEKTNAQLARKLKETELFTQKLEEEINALDTKQKMIQKQREDLQTEVERFVALSESQKVDAASLKTKFDQTCLEFQEEITEKEKELQRAEENCKTQLAARDAKLAEVVRRHEEVMAKRQEEYENTVKILQASTQTEGDI